MKKQQPKLNPKNVADNEKTDATTAHRATTRPPRKNKYLRARRRSEGGWIDQPE